MMRATISAAMVVVSCGLAPATEFHVATTGNDAGAGTAAAPFATLSRARDAVRSLKTEGGLPPKGVMIWIHGGAYELTETFALTEQDSGAPQRPVTYRAVAGEEARLVGGRSLPASAFGKVTDRPAIARIDHAARDHVRCADLRALGITDCGTFPDAFGEPPPVSELFFDDQRMTLARWPNDDWARIVRVIESGVPPGAQWQANKPGTFEYAGDRPTRWKRAPAVWLHGYWCFDWRSETIKVARIDTQKRLITLSKPHGYGIGGGNPAPRRYVAVNLLEELDQPGEYYIDRHAGALYFWPPKPLAQARIVLSTLVDPLISLRDVSHVVLQGLTIETCAGAGIHSSGGKCNQIAACRVRNTGRDGIVIDGGREHLIVACDIHDTGTAGLRISGGDRKTLAPSGHQALNNHIWRVSRRQRTAAYHVHLGGVGVRLAHNLLHDGPHQAIGLAGNDHVIEYNEIHHTGMETDDCGAFYMGRNPSERGTVIRYNFWHDIGSSFTHGSCAVYFDDGSGGQTVFGNVFYRAAGGHFGAVFVHGGHDNTVDNNVFVECKAAIRQAPWDDARWRDQVKGELWQRVLLSDVNITKPPYSTRYPELKGFMEPSGRPRLNYAYRNLIVKCDSFVEGNWVLMDNWVLKSDPGFEDAGAMNFKLKGGSPVFGAIPGFKPIPFEKIGLYRDELRRDLPPRRTDKR